MSDKYRLVTRSDFDGLVCAVLLKELDLIDDILFVHPKDMQDGMIEITGRDITTNLPYVAGGHLAFDHHHSETDPESPARPTTTSSTAMLRRPPGWSTTTTVAPSASRPCLREMMAAVDKADSAPCTSSTRSSSPRDGRC